MTTPPTDKITTVYFVVRADEKGPPGGPYLRRELAERIAAAHEDDAWLLEVGCSVQFFARPVTR